MKVKQYVYIKDADAFIHGYHQNCFCIFSDTSMDGYEEKYFLAGEVEFEINVDDKTIRQSAVNSIEAAEEKERAEHQVKMDMLATKKANLLSLTHQT